MWEKPSVYAVCKNANCTSKAKPSAPWPRSKHANVAWVSDQRLFLCFRHGHAHILAHCAYSTWMICTCNWNAYPSSAGAGSILFQSRQITRHSNMEYGTINHVQWHSHGHSVPLQTFSLWNDKSLQLTPNVYLESVVLISTFSITFQVFRLLQTPDCLLGVGCLSVSQIFSSEAARSNIFLQILSRKLHVGAAYQSIW